jgi:hypothetical protein
LKGLAKLAAGPGNVGITDRDERAPGRGEVLIEVHGAGICGTDLHIAAGEFASRPPVTMGHQRPSSNTARSSRTEGGTTPRAERQASSTPGQKFSLNMNCICRAVPVP